MGAGFAGRIAAEKRSVIIDEVMFANVHNPLLVRGRHRSLLVGVPLLVVGEVLGVLHVGKLTPRLFTEGDTGLLRRCRPSSARDPGTGVQAERTAAAAL